MLAEITLAGTATDDQKNQFWGDVDGGPGGELACRMSQSTGYTMSNIISSGVGLCYMKNMPNVSSGVAITEGQIEPAQIFNQVAADKIVKILITGEGEGQGSQTIFIKVYGSDSVGSSAKNFDMWSCGTGEASPSSIQQIRINTDTGLITTTDNGSSASQGGGMSWYASVSGYLTLDESGNAIFDPTKDRTADFQFNAGDFGTMRSQIVVNSSNQIISKDYGLYSGGGLNCTNKVYSVAGFSGTSFSTLRFNEAGVKGSSACGDYSGTFEGGTEFRDSYYMATLTSALATTASAFDLNTDSFFVTAPSTPTVDMSALSCAPSYDYAVSMDMSAAEPAAVAAHCDSERLSDASYCDNETVLNVKNNMIFQGGGGGGGGGGGPVLSCSELFAGTNCTNPVGDGASGDTYSYVALMQAFGEQAAECFCGHARTADESSCMSFDVIDPYGDECTGGGGGGDGWQGEGDLIVDNLNAEGADALLFSTNDVYVYGIGEGRSSATIYRIQIDNNNTLEEVATYDGAANLMWWVADDQYLYYSLDDVETGMHRVAHDSTEPLYFGGQMGSPVTLDSDTGILYLISGNSIFSANVAAEVPEEFAAIANAIGNDISNEFYVFDPATGYHYFVKEADSKLYKWKDGEGSSTVLADPDAVADLGENIDWDGLSAIDGDILYGVNCTGNYEGCELAQVDLTEGVRTTIVSSEENISFFRLLNGVVYYNANTSPGLYRYDGVPLGANTAIAAYGEYLVHPFAVGAGNAYFVITDMDGNIDVYQVALP